MRITENFIKNILETEFPKNYQEIFDSSMLLQYLDKKMKAVHGDSKARRSLGNIYAIYSLLYFYKKDYYNQPEQYRKFEGYDYMRLFKFYRNLYGGKKLQNHALNSRVNGEFKNKFPDISNNLIISDNGKYLLHIDYLYVDGLDISSAAIKIIEKYIDLMIAKDDDLTKLLIEMESLTDYSEIKQQICKLLTEDSEARIFEIISYAILKSHYKILRCISDTLRTV